ncbi:MAG: hypothetical protein O4804_17995 [Trichodesmium sp. St11_bin5]|nr:hypothetical protein [Trichodesmium sp. St11_bin5]
MDDGNHWSASTTVPPLATILVVNICLNSQSPWRATEAPPYAQMRPRRTVGMLS